MIIWVARCLERGCEWSEEGKTIGDLKLAAGKHKHNNCEFHYREDRKSIKKPDVRPAYHSQR